MGYMNLIIINVLKFLILLIEKWEWRGIELDESDPEKKILNSLDIEGVSVDTDSGFQPTKQIHITQPYRTWVVETENFKLESADCHIVFREGFREVFVKDLVPGDKIITEWGLEEVFLVKETRNKLSMFDLSVDSTHHRYFTGGILSHNTVSSSIMILHFLLFNNNKNALVTANKLDTATEVLDKMGEIYQRIPFFLQQGILNWSLKTKVFENKSRVRGFATTKTSSIGQTADFLYLDEFAYLPDSIAEKFYKSVFPTVSNIDNSKIIITSTPNGFNLFHKLLTDAEKPEGEKSSYIAKRVYWWQVPKRFVTYVRINRAKLEQSGLTNEDIVQSMRENFPNNEVLLKWDEELGKWVVNIFNSPECSEEDVQRVLVKGINVNALGDITTWKKETIKDIGGEEAFNQEYDLRFINESRSLLDETLMEELDKGKRAYKWIPIDEIDDKLNFSYSDLKWVDDDEIYKPELRKDYKIVVSIDTAEGLGLDYSIINIFKIEPKLPDLLERQSPNIKTISDCFKLTQIGIYRSNIISISQLSELLYLIMFEHFNPDNVKAVLEINAYGHELLAHLPHVFEGNNQYGSFVFFRYKHRVDSPDEKIGLKIGDNKNLLVKEYQDRMKLRSISVNENTTISEMSTFIKHTTSAGNVRFAADGSSNDDCVMTVVNISSIFEKTPFKGWLEDILGELPSHISDIINKSINKNNESEESIDYNHFSELRRKFISQNKRMIEARKSWGLTD
jgi:hypothetical protein